MLTQDRIKELCTYCPETGEFIALTARCNGRYKAGEPLGGITGINDNKYYVAKLDGKAYGLHRVAWLYVHGWMPDMVDHRDGNPLNNRIENLRPADSTRNGYNKKINRNSSTGVKGVTWRANRNSWEACIIVRGVRVYRRLFKDFDKAVIAIRSAREELHGEFANHG